MMPDLRGATALMLLLTTTAVKAQQTGSTGIADTSSSSSSSTTTATTTTTTSPELIQPEFTVSRHPDYPWTILRVHYSPEASATNYYMHYRVNFTDLSAVGQSPPGSYLLTGTNPFDLHQLNAGHEYAITIVGVPLDDTVEPRLLFSQTAMTAPKAPDFDGPKAVTSTTQTIMLKGHKPGGALQDTFTISYVQLQPYRRYEPRVIPDVPEQKQVELFLNNLAPGHEYNVSVTADKQQLSSRPWSALITTKPLPPRDVTIADLQATSITLQWKQAEGSGMQLYRVLYQASNEEVAAMAESETPRVTFDGLRPGRLYRFNVFAVVSGETSEANVFYTNTRPEGARSLVLHSRVDTMTFEVQMRSEPSAALPSLADTCRLTVVHERTSAQDNYTLPYNPVCTFRVSLEAGDRYLFWGRLLSNQTESVVLENATVVRPAFDLEAFGLQVALAPEPQQGTIRLSYKRTADAVRVQQLWRRLVGNDSRLLIKVAAGLEQWERQWSPLNDAQLLPLDIDQLPLGQCHQVQLYTVTSSGVVSANRSNLSLRTRGPSAKVTLLVARQTEVELSVQSTADTAWCSLVIKLQLNGQPGTDVINEYRYEVSQRQSRLMITELTPYTDYLLSSTLRCDNDQRCAPTERNIFPVTFTTDEGLPTSALWRTWNHLSPSNATLAWDAPANPNGILSQYLVTIIPTPGEILEQPWNVTVQPKADMSNGGYVQLSNLTGGNQYTLQLRARTSAGYGPSSSRQLKMPIWAPPPPEQQPEILDASVHANDFTVKFNLNMFSTRHGLLKKYDIIVEEVGDSGDVAAQPVSTSQQPLTWSDVQSVRVWPPYVAVRHSLDRSKRMPDQTVTQVIGADPACGTSSERICNGQLKAGHSFRVKLRVYTTDEQHTDSPYSTIITTAVVAGSPGAVVLAVLLCILLLATLALCALLVLKHSATANSKRLRGIMAGSCLRRSGSDSARGSVDQADGSSPRQHKPFSNGLTPHHAAITVVEPSHRRTKSLRERTGVALGLGSAIKHTVAPTVQPDANTHVSRPVPKAKFKDHVLLMSADSDFKFSEEYEELKQVGRGQPCLAADLVCNRVKNRFTNILPFDHSRVKLIPSDDEDGTDYINANYIPGHHGPREFIAAQGPLACTRDDFWRMIWEQQCPAVVNLTKCVEKGRDKCYKYWPDDNETHKYWDLEVTLKNESVHEEWVVREFLLFNLEETGSRQRSIWHLHYVGWPDFGVPDHPQSLVQFVRTFRQRVPSSQSACKPTVVHCSAGVGRSGTFIALDRTLQQFADGAQTVDIFRIVHEMRQQRVCMVQTEQQYICIHQCVLSVLEGHSGQPAPHYPMPVALPTVHNNALRHTQSDSSQSATPSQVLVHQNPAFEDDEGIAESGL